MTLQGDPHHPVGWGVGGFEDPDYRVFILVRRRRVTGEAVIGGEVVADTQPGASCGEASHHGSPFLQGEHAPPRGDGEFLPGSVLEPAEEVRGCPDDAISLVVVAHRVRNGQVNARIVADRGVHRIWDIARRGLEMKHGIQHELQLAAARAKDGVEPDRSPRESLVGLLLD
jgi:hypothetical protein